MFKANIGVEFAKEEGFLDQFRIFGEDGNEPPLSVSVILDNLESADWEICFEQSSQEPARRSSGVQEAKEDPYRVRIYTVR